MVSHSRALRGGRHACRHAQCTWPVSQSGTANQRYTAARAWAFECERGGMGERVNQSERERVACVGGAQQVTEACGLSN